MGNKRRLLVVTRCWCCKDDGCHHQLMMDACKQGRRRGWALEVTINKCTFAAAAVRLRCIVRWLNINAMLCWKLSSLEVAWPARAYTALLPWWELQRILNSVAVCGKLNTWLRACTLNWLISSDSSAAQILHTHLHYQTFNLSDPALLTTMPRRKSIMETIKLKWPLNLFEEKIRSEYLVSWYRQEVCPGQSWVTSSNWGIWTSSIRTFRLLWHKGHTGLQQKGWNIGCYLGSISTLWNFLHPQPKIKSQKYGYRWNTIFWPSAQGKLHLLWMWKPVSGKEWNN